MLNARDTLIFKAKLAEQAERYDDMVDAMKEVVELQQPLSSEERNLLSVAYKNIIGSRRSSWRVLQSINSKAQGDDLTTAVNDFRENIEKELKQFCREILGLLDNFLISDDDTEAKVFYLKMFVFVFFFLARDVNGSDRKGDYFRYLAEIAAAEDRKDISNDALHAYEEASKVAEGLSPTHPIRLGLALNFSVFHYEIMVNHDEACKLAKSVSTNVSRFVYCAHVKA